MSTPPQDREVERPAVPSRPRTRLAVGLVLLAAIVIASFLIPDSASLWQQIRTRLDDWQRWADENPVAAVAAFFIVYVAVTSLSLPVASPMSLVAGAIFGRWLGTGVVSVAATLGATGAFLGSRYLFRDWVRARLGDRLKRIDHGVERDGAYYLLSLRLVPLFPFWMVNLAMGVTPMRVLPYMAVSWVGMLPGTFLFVNAGAVVGAVQSPADVLTPGVIGSFLLLGLVPIAIRKLVHHLGRR